MRNVGQNPAIPVNLSTLHQPYQTSHGARCSSRRTHGPWRWRYRQQRPTKGQAGVLHYQCEKSCTTRRAGVPQASKRMSTR